MHLKKLHPILKAVCVFRNFTSKTTTIFAKFGPSRRRSVNTSICELHSTNAFQVSVHFALLPGIKNWVVTKMVDLLFLETILYFGNFKFEMHQFTLVF